MADYELNRNGQYISYPSFDAFLNGAKNANGVAVYPKVDLSLWDQATMCGTCHVGGVFYEQDRMGNRLPKRLMMDWGPAMADPTRQTLPSINPITTTVWEKYDANGVQTSFPTFAMWAYPVFVGNNPANGAVIAPNGMVPVDMVMNDPNTGAAMQLKAKQLMMPNVKEMDCMFCHFQGYDNISASVMTQAGNLAFAPGAGAGMFDMTPISPTYMGYNGRNANLAFQNVSSQQMGNVAMVKISAAGAAKIKGEPDSDNCMACHATKTLKNLPEMFGTTGTSNGFLSSAPMIYDPANAMGPLGKRMVGFDLNAPFLGTSGYSPAIDGMNFMNYMMPGLAWPQAMGPTPFRNAAFNPKFDIGGGNQGKTGPLYYFNDSANPDQGTMKLSVMPFPRAEWFKRGDAWQQDKDIHGSFGCGGCHYTGDSTHKSQCDPGRGFDMMSGIQDGVPPLKNRNLVTNPDGSVETPDKHDTRNTVKRCEFCHVTRKDYFGQTIDTFGAPNPDAAHQAAGLLVNIVQIVENIDLHGSFGGQGVSDNTNFTTAGKTTLSVGNHLDVMDCTVCHVQKKTMAVRTLDASSGMRFPSVIGTDPQKGMFGMFEDPAPDAFNAGAVAQYNAMYTALGMPLIPAGTHVVGGQLQEWKPLMVWQKLGNLELPLTTNLGAGADFSSGDNSGMKFRRKIYLSNPIVAAIWNNADPAVDANGDGAPGGLLNNSKPSLAGYRDIFTGDLLHKNNAQGYDEPIFDPWIMRDLKEGMNFGPSALSVISVGFKDPMSSPSGMAYDLSGNGMFSSSNYWKYVSIWSGAVVFTEPNQIAEYKAWRTSLNPAKPWTKTEMALIGDPFMVTHGIQNTEIYVKGKNCSDCHGANKGFFNGGFSMTGSAIPADRTFNPTAMLQTASTANDSNSIVPVLDAKGDMIRNPGAPGFGSESNMMERPLEPYRVKALKGDLRTSFEGFNKLGQPRSTEFQAEYHDAVAHKEYVYTVPMQRADVLYPHEKNNDNSELRIYYKLGDVDPATGAVKPGAVAMNGREYATYLEGAALADKAAFGIGVDPVADIATINGVAANGGTSVVQVTQNVAVNLVAASAQTGGTVAYNWLITDGGTLPAGQTVSYNFPMTGTYTLTLAVTDEEGKYRNVTQTVQVVAPQVISFGAIATDVPTQVTTVPVNITAAHTKVMFYWGDGSSATTVLSGAATVNGTHKYIKSLKYAVTDADPATAGNQPGYKYTTQVQVYNNTTLVGTKAVTVYVVTP